LTEAARIGSGGWFASIPDIPACDAPGLNAVIGGLKPGDLTLELFRGLPAKLLGQSAGLLSGEGLLRQENMTQSRHEPILTGGAS
jgi:hypothetical protein